MLACSLTMAGEHVAHAQATDLTGHVEHDAHAEHLDHGAGGLLQPSSTVAQHPSPPPADDWPCQDLAHCVAAVLPVANGEADQQALLASPPRAHAQQALSSRSPGLEPPPPKR